MATSNFIDTATIWLHAGKGGDGAVTFHREKFVAAGGPDGGDGGRGGDIIFVADDNLSTLMDFRYKRKYTAPDGENGRAKRMSGADGDDLVIRVPRGTIIRDQKKVVPCCAYLEGEYGQNDICIGVPAVIGRKGIEKIVKLDLTKEEAAKFEASAAAVRKTNQVLHEIKAL
mgnify:CR=1 FL=1